MCSRLYSPVGLFIKHVYHPFVVLREAGQQQTLLNPDMAHANLLQPLAPGLGSTSSPQEERLLSAPQAITAQPFHWLRTPASPSALHMSQAPIPAAFKSWRPFLLWGSSPHLMRTQHYWRKQETRQQQPEDPGSDESCLSSLCFHWLKCSSAVLGELTWGNASPKRWKRTIDVIEETQPWWNEICNMAVASNRLCALFEDVKRSKECTLATWGLTSAGSISPLRGHNCQSMDQNGWEIPVQGTARSGKHYQESAAQDWERLLEQGKTQHPSQYTFGGQGSKKMTKKTKASPGTLFLSKMEKGLQRTERLRVGARTT